MELGLNFLHITGFRGTKGMGVGEVRDSRFLTQRAELGRGTSVRAGAMVSLGGRCPCPRPALFWALNPETPKQDPDVRGQEGDHTKGGAPS